MKSLIQVKAKNGQSPWKCNYRRLPVNNAPQEAKNITLSILNYLPFDSPTTMSFSGRNMFGVRMMKNYTLKAGHIYPSFDGKRLILEVGCSHIIFIQISPKNGLKHHHFFIQKGSDFAFDTYTRFIASEVSRGAQPMLTIIKYAIYFMMGLYSTLGWGAWLTVTGSDLLVTVLQNEKKLVAFGELARVWVVETQKLKQNAPTLYKKMKQILEAESKKVGHSTLKKLPKEVLTDEKAQAQLAGVLFGKHTVEPKSLTVWAALLAVFVQASVTSVTNTSDAAKEALDDRYLTGIKGITHTTWYDAASKKQAIRKVGELFQSAKVPTSDQEILKIIEEVQKNPTAINGSLGKIANAIKKATSEDE